MNLMFFVYITRYLHTVPYLTVDIFQHMKPEATDGMDPPVDAKPIMDTSALPGNRLAGGDTEEDPLSVGPVTVNSQPPRLGKFQLSCCRSVFFRDLISRAVDVSMIFSGG